MSDRPLAGPRVVVFDLDGTLVDSLGDLTAAIAAVMEARRRPAWPAERVRRWIGEGAELLVAKALTDGRPHEADPAEVRRALDEFRTVYFERATVETTLFDGAHAALDAVRALGIRTAILTNKPARPTEAILRHFDLLRRCDAWLGGDGPLGRKPDPKPLVDVAARALGGAPLDPRDHARIWLVGDSATDIRTAHNAKATAIAVRGGYDAAEPIDECDPGPHRVLERLAEVAELLLGCVR
jgi:phosphoglycolate phosphatase